MLYYNSKKIIVKAFVFLCKKRGVIRHPSRYFHLESFLLVVSRDIRIRCLIGTEIIKSSVWTTTLIPVAGRDTFCVKGVEIILLHDSTTFYGALTPRILLSCIYIILPLLSNPIMRLPLSPCVWSILPYRTVHEPLARLAHATH